MMTERKWRFPSANGGNKQGPTGTGEEVFRGGQYISLAREVLQNSIDAALDNEKPLRVEFITFSMKAADIPGSQKLCEQIDRCCDYYSDDNNACAQYKEMKKTLQSDKKIECLRISDYNTTGLRGIQRKDPAKNNFLALAKSEGASIKDKSLAGGSKGAGKNAVFTMSRLKLVWYESITDQGERGSIGVANWMAGFEEGHEDDFDRYTQGRGYYADDENSHAIPELLMHQYTSFERQEYGTDIYIFDFIRKSDDQKWKQELIQSAISSFIVAIYRNKLAIRIDDLTIDATNLEDILKACADHPANNRLYQLARSNHALLQNKNGKVKTFDLTITDKTADPEASLFIMKWDKEQEELTTHCCDIVRYPYMRIKSTKKWTYYPFSALCIIGDNKLGKLLRSIENINHNKWEPARLTKEFERKHAQAVLDKLDDEIYASIKKAMGITNNATIDPLGAGEYLPALAKGSAAADTLKDRYERDNSDEVILGKLRRNTSLSLRGIHPDPNSISIQPDIGAIERDEDGNVMIPEGNNKGKGEDVRPGPETAAKVEGDSFVLLKENKKPVQYKLITIDAALGIYKIIFVAPITHDCCYLTIRLIDDAANKYGIRFKRLTYQGKEIAVCNGEQAEPFAITAQTRCTLTITAENIKDNFGGEVIIKCKRMARSSHIPS